MAAYRRSQVGVKDTKKKPRKSMKRFFWDKLGYKNTRETVFKDIDDTEVVLDEELLVDLEKYFYVPKKKRRKKGAKDEKTEEL